MKKILCIFLAAILSLAVLVSCGKTVDKKETFGKNGDKLLNEIDKDDDKGKIKNDTGKVTLGDEFVFDGLKIKYIDTYKVVKCENEYSEYEGKDLLVIPVNVMNISEETKYCGTMYATFFGSNGTETEDAGYSFADGLSMAGYLRPGCGKNAYLYLVYDGDGEYAVEYSDFRDKLEIVFDVRKDNVFDETKIEKIDSVNTPRDGALGLDASFTFDAFDIEFGGSCETVKIENEFSEYNGLDAVKIPVTITNNSGESAYSGFYDLYAFGPHGTELDNVAFYFEDSIDSVGEMRDGASVSGYLYYISDGSGLYALEFLGMDESYNIEFNVD